ncbi:MAG: molybdenum ABC transporter ATP-binding protein [Litoreibacter sp.]
MADTKGAAMIEIQVMRRSGDFTLDAGFSSEGGVVAIYGPSGAGKTTLINAIAGLVTPDVGFIKIGEHTLFDSAHGIDVAPHKRRIGYVFQEPRLFPHLNVAANMRYGAKPNTSLVEIADLLGISHLLKRRPRDLSGGEAQRVAIARALLSDPDVLLMDEPLAALDVSRKGEILPYLAEVRRHANIPIFYVSHSMPEVAQLAHDLVLMRDGQVTRYGPIADILSDPDAIPDLGVREAGAILQATLSKVEAGDGLSELTTDRGTLLLPQIKRNEGDVVTVRIRASDVMLARDRPDGLSALNILPVRISEIREGHGPGVAVRLVSGKDTLIARITARSARVMELAQGQDLFAVIKSVSVAPDDVGGQIVR